MAEDSASTDDDRCDEWLLHDLAQAVEESEVSEIIWQALICAYMDHDGWRTVAEALFVKHGYTVEEIVREHS